MLGIGRRPVGTRYPNPRQRPRRYDRQGASKGGDVTRVWLPDPPETIEPLKTLPDGIEVDVWTGGDAAAEHEDEVEFIVLPPGRHPRHAKKNHQPPQPQGHPAQLRRGRTHPSLHPRPHHPRQRPRRPRRGDRRVDGRRDRRPHQELPALHPSPGKTGVGLHPQRAGRRQAHPDRRLRLDRRRGRAPPGRLGGHDRPDRQARETWRTTHRRTAARHSRARTSSSSSSPSPTRRGSW